MYRGMKQYPNTNEQAPVLGLKTRIAKLLVMMRVMKHNRNTKKKTQTNTLKDNRRGRLQFGRLNTEQRKAEQRINCRPSVTLQVPAFAVTQPLLTPPYGTAAGWVGRVKFAALKRS